MLLSVPALATPSEDLALARQAFRNGNYQIALEKYNALVRPKPQLANSLDLVEAYVNLGVCRVETGDEAGAKSEFEKALEIDPNKQLDPLIITNKKAIELFDDTKADIRTRKDREAAKRREFEEKERIRKFRESLIGVKDNPYWLNFVPPFGQFQNKHYVKGVLLGVGEVATLGTSIGIWWYLVNKYGIRSDQVDPLDGASVRRLQQIEIGAGVAFLSLYALGVIDAHRHYTAKTRTDVDESLLPPEWQESTKKPATPKKTSLLRRLQVAPMITPDGVGIGIGWEN
ncbi:MAG TPA: tetratricopeptide repeat protein [Kofleriaceae bacterium]